MKDIGLLSDNQWHPFSYVGFTHPFFSLDTHTIINTWIVLATLILLVFAARIALHNKLSIGRFIVIAYVRAFIDLVSQSLGYFSSTHTIFILSLFTFIVLCNCIALIPWVEEPTKELTTTLALGLISFIYIQAYAIKTHGVRGYLKEYITPFFFMFPLHVIGKLSTVISISFRLFGNIFGGATIIHIYTTMLERSWFLEMMGLISGLNIVMAAFFIIFEGCLQAFVFTMLTTTYLAIALAHDDDIGEMT